MKVIMINSVYGHGSTGKIVLNLCEMLENKNERALVLYGRGNNCQDERAIKVSTKLGVYKHVLLARAFDKAGFFSAKETNNIISIIKEYNPDIIHLHNMHGYYVNIQILLDFLGGTDIPIVWTLHDCWAITGHCTYFSYAECNKWKTKCNHCKQKKKYPMSVLLDNSLRNFEIKKKAYSKVTNITIVCVSKWLASVVKDSILATKRIEVIYNGLDMNKFRPTKSNIREKLGIRDKYMFLCVSDDWDERKGVADIFLLSKKIGSKAVVVVIGANKKQRESFPENVIGIEKTWNQQELIEYYSAADVFFNPSREETFGMVTVEAMACGTPVIVYDTTACKELVDVNCGIVLPYLQLNRTPVEQLFLDKSKYSSACRKRAVSLFDENICYENYYHLYQELIQERDTLNKDNANR